MNHVVLYRYHKLLFRVSLPNCYMSSEKQYKTLTVAVVLTPLSRIELTKMYLFILLLSCPVRNTEWETRTLNWSHL